MKEAMERQVKGPIFYLLYPQRHAIRLGWAAVGSRADHFQGFVLLPGLVVEVKVAGVCAINSRTERDCARESLEGRGLSLIAVFEVEQHNQWKAAGL